MSPQLGFFSLNAWNKALQNFSVDPYFVWADLLGYRNFAVDQTNGSQNLPNIFQFIGELGQDSTVDDLKKLIGEINTRYPSVVITVPNYFICANFKVFSLFFNRQNLDELATIRQILLELLSKDKQKVIKRLQLGYPQGPGGMPETRALTKDEKDILKDHRVVIGVIDDYIPFAHRSLVIAGTKKTRVLSVWNQSLFFQQNNALDFGYGTVSSNQELNTALEESIDDFDSQDSMAYSTHYGISNNQNANRFARRISHGAAVVTTAAGRYIPADRTEEAGDELGPQVNDEFDKIPILAVQFPIEQTELSSGKWIAPSALDAFSWIASYVKDSGTQCIVNMSYGTLGGAHDGTGLLETGLKEQLNHYKNIGLVLPVGNSFQNRVYALKTLKPNDTKASFFVHIPAEKLRETFIEFWIPQDSLNSNDTIDFTVTRPGDSGPLLEVNTATVPIAVTKDPSNAALIFAKNPAQSTKKSLFLFAALGTQKSVDEPGLRPGVWEFTIKCSSNAQKEIIVESWIERDEVSDGGQRPQAVQFRQDLEPDFDLDQLVYDPKINSNSDYYSRDFCATNTSTTHLAWTVGAYVKGASFSATGKIVPSKYTSSMITTQDSWLTFSARGDAFYTMQGLKVHGSFSGVFGRVSGTSIASAFITREIALKLFRNNTETIDTLREKIDSKKPKKAKTRIGTINDIEIQNL